MVAGAAGGRGGGEDGGDGKVERPALAGAFWERRVLQVAGAGTELCRLQGEAVLEVLSDLDEATGLGEVAFRQPAGGCC